MTPTRDPSPSNDHGSNASLLRGQGVLPARAPDAAAVDARPRGLVVAPQPFFQDRGTPIAVRNVVEALVELGYDIDVLTLPLGRSLPIPGVRYYRVRNPLGIRTVPIGFSFRKLSFDILLFLALRKRLRVQRYLWIHAVEEAAFLAVPAARRHGIPVVYDMQSSMAEQLAMKPLLRNRLAKRLLDACERWLCRNADYVVSSAGLASRVREAAPLTRVQELRYPSLVREVAAEEVDRLRAELGISAGQPVVLYTGTFEDYQGLSTLIDAVPEVVSNVAEVVFVLVGAAPSKAAELLKRLGGRVPPGAIRMVERQPESAIPTYLAMAKVVVSPRSSGSNLPLKVLQYLSAGRAIVATAIDAHRTILTDELAVLAEPKSSSALASAISGLLKNPAKVAELESAARQYADQNLDWSKFVRLIESLHPQLDPPRASDQPPISDGRSEAPT